MVIHFCFLVERDSNILRVWLPFFLDFFLMFWKDLLEWGRTFSDFFWVRQFFIFTVSKRTRMFVLQMKSKVFFITSAKREVMKNTLLFEAKDTLRSFSKLYFSAKRKVKDARRSGMYQSWLFWQDWACKVCRFSVLFGYFTKWEPN